MTLAFPNPEPQPRQGADAVWFTGDDGTFKVPFLDIGALVKSAAELHISATL